MDENLLLVIVVVLLIVGGILIFYFKKNTATPEVAKTSPGFPQKKTNVYSNVLSKTRLSLQGFLGELLSKSKLQESDIDQILDALLLSDVGVLTSEKVIKELKKLHEAEKPLSEQLSTIIQNNLNKSNIVTENLFERIKKSLDKPFVIFVLGVNGAGKTTSIGKLAYRAKREFNLKVLLVAGDTFRAAATEQLDTWNKRAECDLFAKENSNPSGLVFDALEHAKNNNYDLVIIDSAGRLQTKVPLMEELGKINRTMKKVQESAPHETMLVLDSTTGQNGLSQALKFNEAVKIDSILLTKLDGTSKGGITLAIADQLGIPIRLIGVGEGPSDLREFEPQEFAKALIENS